MNLWTPPGVDLGEFAGPETDPRMINFLGGLDANGQPLPLTYRRLRAAADDWIITDATPEGPARLLKAARDMFALGFYAYGVSQTFRQGVELRGREGWLGEQTAEAVTAGVGG